MDVNLVSDCKINYEYLRSKKAFYLKEWYTMTFEHRNNLKAPIYSNAVILPLKKFSEDNLLFGRGGVIDENKEYVNHSAIDNRVQFAYEYDECDFENKKVVYCGYLVNHWGHFLVEAVSRLWYFLRNDNTVDKYVFFVGYGEIREIKGNYKEFFELLGIYDKIEIINKPTCYKNVIVPELGYKWREYFSDDYKNIFNKIVENAKIESEWDVSNKIYFSRSKLKGVNKKEFGLDMLDSYFEKNGYRVVYPERISLSHLIFLIRNAETVASLSGSLPHNMLFAEDCSKLEIIERNVLNNEIQIDVNRMKCLNVTYVDANIAIYLINLGYGPFILSYKGNLEKFTEGNKYCPPDKKYYNDKYMKKCFIKYMKAYIDAYHYSWFMEDWMIRYTDYIREAYFEGEKYFGKYINGLKPFKLSHYFKLHYIKQIIKSLID